ncbi:MAG: hypothetical protein AAB930_00705 [Patescibacteria group bacterium]
MPESLEQINTITSQESPITLEERERFRDLLERFYLTYDNNEREVVELRNKIFEENGKLAQYILGELNLGNLSSEEIYKYVQALGYCAAPAQAGAIGTFLESDTVALEHDCSTKSRLTKILTRIGGVENIDQLVSFAEKTLSTPYYQGETRFPRSQYDAIDAYGRLWGALCF